MHVRAFINKEPKFSGLVISGCIYLFFKLVLFLNFSLFFFLLTLALGFQIGGYIKIARKNYPGLTGGFIPSLIYVPIFLILMSDMMSEPYSWNLFIVLIALPGYILLKLTGLIDFLGSPFLSYLASGLITIILLFLISSIISLNGKPFKGKLRH